MNSFLKVLLVTIFGLSLIFLLPWLLGVRTIEAGEVAVVTRFGQVTGRVLSPGFHVITPFVEGTVTYNTKKVTYETLKDEALKEKEDAKDYYKDHRVDTNTEDGQPVDVYFTIRFSVDPTKASWVLQNIGDENALVDKIVKTESRVWARNIPRRFKAEELYTGEGSQKVQNEIYDHIKDKFTENGLILDFVGIREIVFDSEYVTAIKDKQVAAVQVETEKNKAEQEKYRKEQRVTAAEASAREQELQRLTLSPLLIQKMFIEKWDGAVSKYTVNLANDQQGLIIQLPENIGQ